MIPYSRPGRGHHRDQRGPPSDVEDDYGFGERTGHAPGDAARKPVGEDDGHPDFGGFAVETTTRRDENVAFNSPDFFDKALFQDFIRTLREQEVLRRNSEGMLEFDDDVQNIGEDARLVLGEEIRHSILSLTFSAPGLDKL